jgi:hypothetical protein
MISGRLANRKCSWNVKLNGPAAEEYERIDTKITRRLAQRTIALRRPIYDPQLRHVLQSQVLAMDETPHKAGRKGKRKLNTVRIKWPTI